MKNFRKHLSILLAVAMLFGSAQFTFAEGAELISEEHEEPAAEETLIEVASNIAAEEPEPESVKESNSVSETAAQELMCVPMMRTFKSAPSSDTIRFGNLIVSGFVMIAAIQAFFSGMVLETINRKNRQDFELELIRANKTAQRQS